MAISAISGFNPGLALINAVLQPTPLTGVTSATGLGSLFSLASTQTSISSVGRLLNAAEALGLAASALAVPGSLAARTASSSKATVATATAGDGTPLGSHQVVVGQLAQAQSLTTALQANALSAIGNGNPTTLSFQFASGVSRTVALGSGNNTLTGIASAINDANIGIQAQVTNSAAGSRLTLTGPSGAANAFTIGVAGEEAVADLFAGANQTSQARDAQGTVDGIAFTASTNTVNTAVGGLTLNLAGVGDATLNITPNTDRTDTVGAFVAAYNAVQTGLAGLGQDNPALTLNAFFLRSQLGATLGTGSAGADAASLSQIGIDTNADGTLSFNPNRFQAALTNDPQAVAKVFSNGGQGIAEKIATLATDALSPDSLLQIAAPALDTPANLAANLQASLFSSLFDNQNQTQDFSSAVNLSNQFLLAELSSSSLAGNGQNDNALLDQFILDSRLLSQNLASLGSQLNLIGIL